MKKIQEKLIDNFTIEKGIAKNRILLENLFALFVCINIKIPIIICGKPGCSKSLSVKLIDMAMKGKKSENLLELDLLKYPDLKEGEVYLSVVDQDKTIIDHIKNDRTDVIPIKQACKGLNGSFVSYVDKIYKIENCRKREIDPEYFVSKYKNIKLKEISSNQWVSLPDGKPLN